MSKFLMLISVTLIYSGALLAQSRDVFIIKAFITGQQNHVVQTGFRLKGKKGIVTALHGLTGSTMKFSARNEFTNEWKEVYSDLKIVEVDVTRDVALLSSESYKTSTNFGFEANTVALAEWQQVNVIGHPGGIFERKSLCWIGSPATDILSRLMATDNSYNYFRTRGSPAVNKTVLSVQGHFVGGHSGAPLVTLQNKVIGVVNGGIMDSRPGISWAIPIKDIDWEVVNPNLLAKIKNMDPIREKGPFIGQLVAANASILEPKLENELKFRLLQFRKGLLNLQAALSDAEKEANEFNGYVTGTTLNSIIENSKILVVCFKLGGFTSPCITNTSEGAGTVWIGNAGYGIRHLPDQRCSRYKDFEDDDLTTFQIFSEKSITTEFNSRVEALQELAGKYPPEQLNAVNRWFDIWNTANRDKILEDTYNDFTEDLTLIKEWYLSIEKAFYSLTAYLTQHSGGNFIKS